jgi:hypothetical protein
MLVLVTMALASRAFKSYCTIEEIFDLNDKIKEGRYAEQVGSRKERIYRENSIRFRGIHVEPTYKLDKALGIL